MAPHSSTLAWKIPWMEEPGGLQSMGSRRVRHDWATSLPLSLSCIGEGNGNPLQCSSLENPRDRGAWWAAIYGISQSQTQLKWLSSSIANTICNWHVSPERLGLPKAPTLISKHVSTHAQKPVPSIHKAFTEFWLQGDLHFGRHRGAKDTFILLSQTTPN